MKHINWNNIIKLASIGALLLAGFVAVYAADLPTGESSTLVNRYFGTAGNSNASQIGILDIAEFELAPKGEQTDYFSLGTNGVFNQARQILFRSVGTSIFDDIIVYEDTAINSLFVGYDTLQAFSNGDPRLQVDGTVKIESLADAGADDYEPLCTDDFGRLLRCGSGGGGLNGVCGISNGGTYSSPPSSGLCSGGTASSVNDGGGFADPRYTWSCIGSITTANCTADYEAAAVAVCGSSSGGSFPSAPSTNLCSIGTASSVTDNTGGGPDLGSVFSTTQAFAEESTPDYTWSCTLGASVVGCSASQSSTPVNGVCGSADGGTTSSAPSTNLCSVGTTSFVLDGGVLSDPRYTWTCAGSGGGSTDSCNSNYAATPVYVWVIGSWTKCAKSSQTRSVTCTQDGSIVSNNVCNTNIPPTPASAQSC